MAAVTSNRHSSFGKDTGLQARMLLTLFLLGLVYAVLIGVLIAVGAGGVTILVVALGLLALQLFTSDKIAMGTMGVKEVSPGAGARAARDHRAALRAGGPAQAAGVRDGERRCPTPSRWAAHRSRRRCARRVASWSCSSPAELEGVLAHELTHVVNRDVMVMTLASFFATVASLIVAVRLLLRRRLRRRVRPRRQRGRRGGSCSW